MDQEEARNDLIMKIETALDQRLRKADRNPNNPSHTRSAEVLRHLHTSLNLILPTDPSIVAYLSALYWPHSAIGVTQDEDKRRKANEAFSTQIEAQVSVEDAFIRQYGYKRSDSGDAREFLARLNELLRGEKLDPRSKLKD